jgi:serine/threonine protein kinase
MQEEKKEASVNNYTLLKDLGSGLNSKVKLGMDKTTGIHYAIKVARKGPKMNSNRDSMINENKILMDLQHPNIVRLHELCVDGVTTKPGKQPTK